MAFPFSRDFHRAELCSAFRASLQEVRTGGAGPISESQAIFKDGLWLLSKRMFGAAKAIGEIGAGAFSDPHGESIGGLDWKELEDKVLIWFPLTLLTWSYKYISYRISQRD